MYIHDIIQEACCNRGVVFTSIWATSPGKEAIRKERNSHGCFLCKQPLGRQVLKALTGVMHMLDLSALHI